MRKTTQTPRRFTLATRKSKDGDIDSYYSDTEMGVDTRLIRGELMSAGLTGEIIYARAH